MRKGYKKTRNNSDNQEMIPNIFNEFGSQNNNFPKIKRKRNMQKYNFKPYDQSVQMLIPPSWEEYIPINHIVRVVDSVVEKINLDTLLREYNNGNGRASYNPKMLLKLIIYGYLNNIYSSRQLEAFCIENICCAWLTALSRPDHNTINRFRSERLKSCIKEIFNEVVKMLIETGHVSLQDIFIDGTKIEANANKYKFVWGKLIKKNKIKIGEQLEEIWEYAEQVAKEELNQIRRPDFKEIDSETLQKTIEKIDLALENKQPSIELKKKIKDSKTILTKRLEQYEEKEKILGERNSYSITDNDATRMRMKEYNMPNGPSKAAYNVQISTNNQVVLDYNIFQNPTDTTTLPKHVMSLINLYNKKPNNIIADAGYGGEENYKFLEDEQIEAYVKYNNYDSEQRNKSEKITRDEQFVYNEEKSCYCCLAGQKLDYVESKEKKTSNGYVQEIDTYRLPNCVGCLRAEECAKPKEQKTIEINERGRNFRRKANQLLTSQKGQELIGRRKWDVEPVFGDIKYNNKFVRFLLRGLKKVMIEMGLVCIVHNIKKLFNFPGLKLGTI